MLPVLAMLGICKRDTLVDEAGGMTVFTVGGTGSSVQTCVVDAKLTGVTDC